MKKVISVRFPDFRKMIIFDSMERKRLKGLSLNGGGARGIIQVEQLVALEDALGVPLYEHFDYISGTSVGSISAALIATGRSARQVRSIMHDEIRNIFDKPFYRLGLFRSKYSNDALVKGCKKHLKGQINETGKKWFPYLLIPAVNSHEDKPVIFKSTTGTVMLSDAVIASCSAGYYFPQYSINGIYYEDGGMSHNNPSDIIREQALKHHTIDGVIPIVDIVNITTGAIDLPTTNIERVGGLRAIPKTLETLLRQQDLKTHGQMAWQYGAQNQYEVDTENVFNNENGVYIRMESKINASSGKIDDASESNIKAMIEDGQFSVNVNYPLFDFVRF